jgi:hypothetical protein
VTAVAEVIYCDIKNINGQYNVAKKNHLEVIIKRSIMEWKFAP